LFRPELITLRILKETTTAHKVADFNRESLETVNNKKWETHEIKLKAWTLTFVAAHCACGVDTSENKIGGGDKSKCWWSKMTRTNKKSRI
jgi:hypothetical protein